jgi:hypothetical protein
MAERDGMELEDGAMMLPLSVTWGSARPRVPAATYVFVPPVLLRAVVSEESFRCERERESGETARESESER